MSDADLTLDAAKKASEGKTLEELARPFLDLLHQLTGLDSTYLTEIRWDAGEQEIIFSDNRGALDMPENLVVKWEDALCRRALSAGKRYTNDVPSAFPDATVAHELGLQTYVSVPIFDQCDQVMGTLCGASSDKVDIAPDVIWIMEFLARLIADQWQRDRLHSEMARRVEDVESRLRQRALFLAEAEHKLKSPLTIVRGWLELLTEEWERFSDEERLRSVNTARDAAVQMSSQIDDMLNEARSEVLTTDLEIASVDVTSAVERVCRELAGSTKEHKIECSVPTGIVASADETALWQVLWHLGENATKYSPDGGTIVIDAKTDDGQVTVSVSDEGIGIPEDVDIFAPFTRSTSATTGSVPGTGLGLYIVRNLVCGMGGDIRAERRPDKGSTLTFSLPSAH